MNPDGLGLMNEPAEGLSGTLIHSAQGGVIRTKITLTADTQIVNAAAASASKAGGVRLFDFPAGKIVVVGARISGRAYLSDSSMRTSAGEIGLGTVVATGAVSVLGGTATFEDILEGGNPGLTNIVDGDIVEHATWDDHRPFVPAAGSGFNASCFLNAAAAFTTGSTTNLLMKAGSEIEVLWVHLER